MRFLWVKKQRDDAQRRALFGCSFTDDDLVYTCLLSCVPSTRDEGRPGFRSLARCFRCLGLKRVEFRVLHKKEAPLSAEHRGPRRALGPRILPQL
ncbi:hypothetical protein ACER0C_019891 [Sarotherodon galilaeus]